MVCFYLITDNKVFVNITGLTDTAVGLNNEFIFTCTVNTTNVNITVIIDNNIDDNKLDQLTSTVIPNITNGVGYNYTFNDVIPIDNGSTFYCIASNDTDVYSSDNITIQVIG